MDLPARASGGRGSRGASCSASPRSRPGRAIVPDENRTGYAAGVLANVGTTLLLVGIVVLLERRIVDTAVRAVRKPNDEARLATTSTRRCETDRSLERE